MKHSADMRGAAAVSRLATLPEPEQWLVRCLRQWCELPAPSGELEASLGTCLGPARAHYCLHALDEMLGILARHGRRSLMRHQANCVCVGADEAVFAHFVMVAAAGEREDAMLLASLLVEGPLLVPLVEAARQVGLCFRQAALRGHGDIPDPASATRH